MRINRYLAAATGVSRRQADSLVGAGRVQINGRVARLPDTVLPDDVVLMDGQPLHRPTESTTLLIHKPAGYVCSRAGQGSRTIYDLLPPEFHALKPVGRLDKDSSGLLLLTDDGQLAHQLTHPRYEKTKHYLVSLSGPLTARHTKQLAGAVLLSDGPSHLHVTLADGSALPPTVALAHYPLLVAMHEGRNRQIRRTFSALGLTVTALHRVQFGNYSLGDLAAGAYCMAKHSSSTST